MEDEVPPKPDLEKVFTFQFKEIKPGIYYLVDTETGSIVGAFKPWAYYPGSSHRLSLWDSELVKVLGLPNNTLTTG